VRRGRRREQARIWARGCDESAYRVRRARGVFLRRSGRSPRQGPLKTRIHRRAAPSRLRRRWSWRCRRQGWRIATRGTLARFAFRGDAATCDWARQRPRDAAREGEDAEQQQDQAQGTRGELRRPADEERDGREKDGTEDVVVVHRVPTQRLPGAIARRIAQGFGLRPLADLVLGHQEGPGRTLRRHERLGGEPLVDWVFISGRNRSWMNAASRSRFEVLASVAGARGAARAGNRCAQAATGASKRYLANVGRTQWQVEGSSDAHTLPRHVPGGRQFGPLAGSHAAPSKTAASHVPVVAPSGN
jgi:hypothetical protein